MSFEDFQSDHEKYLAGQPLAPWLANVLAGKDDQPVPIAALASEGKYEPRRGPLTRQERLQLRDMTREPGWPIFQRLLVELSEKQEKKAVQTSQDDPVANEKAIAALWAYVASYKRVISDISTAVDGETANLDEEAKAL